MWMDADGRDNYERVVSLIRSQSPDVVSLVEVDERWEASRLKAMADELDLAWMFVPALEYQGSGGFGNALLSRLPIRAVSQWGLLSPRIYDGTEPSEQRVVALAQVLVEGQRVWIGSTHLPRSNQESRREASDCLLRALPNLESPWVLAGDFNQPKDSWLPPDVIAAPDPPRPTYKVPNLSESIDYFLAKKLALEACVLDSNASDHLPVIARIDTEDDAQSSERSLASIS
jgi:endonuclease/exonuclease/phosphatase family metal-dependent hydrolase